MMVPSKIEVQENSEGTWLCSFNVPFNYIHLDVQAQSLSNLDELKERVLSGDDQFPKVRKPYTITKQREKWTEEEHRKFLEALQLHGRNWRRIEEQIGTKTAIQIRSHAQKFFSKVVRESNNNDGTSSLKATDIPPPRPKRKPLHPYPRKLGSFPSKSITIPKKPERPVQFFSACEQENISPTSVLSHFLELPMSKCKNGYASPGSSADGSSDEENGGQSPISKIEGNIPPFGCLSMAHEHVELDCLPCGNVNPEEARSVEAPTIKLFGKTIALSDPQKPYSKPMPSIDTSTATDKQIAVIGIQPLHGFPSSGDHYSAGLGAAHLPWSIFWRNKPLQVLSPPSFTAEAECGQEMQREGSLTGSSTAIGDQNSDVADSTEVETRTANESALETWKLNIDETSGKGLIGGSLINKWRFWSFDHGKERRTLSVL